MKRVFYTAFAMAVFCIWVVMSGCAGIGVGVKGPNPFEADPACTIYPDMGIDPATSTGVIPKYIKNPCAAQSIVVSITRTGVVLEAYQVEEYAAWVEQAKTYIKIGLSTATVKLYIGAQVGKLNRKFGAMYFILSDLFLVIPDADLLAGDDITLIHASLDDSVVKAREVAGMLN
jgi:hypothetical protein